MQKSNKIVLIGTQIMVHAQLHIVVLDVPGLKSVCLWQVALSWKNCVLLQLIALRRGKPVQMPRGPRRGWLTFFFLKENAY